LIKKKPHISLII
jgi:superoxide dismutase, Cu-Zn family